MTLYLDEMRLRMAIYFVNAKWQKRKGLLMSDDRLMRVAQRRATDMAVSGYFDHQDQDGYWPNFWVERYGYQLPDHWSPEKNNVESIGMGFSTPETFMEALYTSEDHRPHVTGNMPFFFAHRYFGVGYRENVNGVPYYVLATAPPEPVDDDEHNIFFPGVYRGKYRMVRVG